MKIEYPNQKKVTEKIADYGIFDYTIDQEQLHKDIMKLLKSSRYQKIPADDCMVVFGRVYSTYCLSQLEQDKKIALTSKSETGDKK